MLPLAELLHRPGRAAFLLGGYAVGVAVMVVLLAVGEAMLEQAREGELVGGGDVVLVPAGISPDLLRAGGATALFLGIDHARFLHRQVLESPRGREDYGVVAASPLIDNRMLRITHRGRTVQALARGEIPSRARHVAAAPDLVAGSWADSPADRLWLDPSPEHLYDRLDRFTLPTGAARDSTWAEWHYFNVVLDEDRWLYLTFMVAGEVGTPGRWGGRLLLTVRSADGEHRSYTRDLPPDGIAIDTAAADLRLSPDARVVQENGVYHVTARVASRSVDLRITPLPRRYFPRTDLGGEALVSGYVVPALAAVADGEVCLPRCVDVRAAPAYHDHNWGVWRDVSWDWGAASSERTSLLYGAVHAPDLEDRGLFAYLVDDRGARGVYRPDRLIASDHRNVQVGRRTVRVPYLLAFDDPRRGLAVRIDVSAAHVTDLERENARYFVQMRGTATVGEVGRTAERLTGFFEIYVD